MYEVPYLLFKSVFRSRHKLKISWISCSRILIEDQHRIALLVAELDLPQCANYVQAGIEPCSEIRWIGPAGLCQANSAIWKSIGNEYVIETIRLSGSLANFSSDCISGYRILGIQPAK